MITFLVKILHLNGALQFIAKVRQAVINGPIKSSSSLIVWCPLGKALSAISGGHWVENKQTLTVDFFGGGFAAAYFLKKWLFVTFEKGVLTLDVQTVWKSLPYIFSRYFDKAVSVLKDCDPNMVSIGNRPYVESIKKRRLSTPSIMSHGQAPPECIKCSLTQRQPFDNAQRWQIAHTVVTFAKLTNTDADATAKFIVDRMRERGDGEKRIKEFLANVKNAKPDVFPCHKRTKKSGLWCPYGGGPNVAQCLQTRSHAKNLDVLSMTPSLVWGS